MKIGAEEDWLFSFSCVFIRFFIVSFCQYSFRFLLQSVKYRFADFFPNRIWCHLLTSFNESPFSNFLATCLFSWGVRCKVFLTSVLSIFVYLIWSDFWKKGFQISMSRDFSEKIRQNKTLPKKWDFCVFAKQALSKKLGISRFRQTGLVQKIETFTEIRYTYESQF